MTIYTPAGWATLTDRILEFAQTRTVEAGSMFVRDALKAFSIDFVTFSRVRDDLEQSGRIVNLGRCLGYAVPGVVPPAYSLAGLLHLASSHLSESAGRRGRRRVADTIGADRLSKSNWIKSRTAINYIDGRLARENLPPLEISLSRDPISDDWVLIQALQQDTDFLSLSQETRNAHRSSLRALLLFGEAHGCLRAGPDVVPFVEAAEWIEWINTSFALLNPTPSHSDRVRLALRTIARLATQARWLPTAEVNWDALPGMLEAASVRGALITARVRETKTVLRQLSRAGSIRLTDAGPHTGNPYGLFPDAMMKRAVKTLDYSDWCARDGTPLARLGMELRRYQLWLDKSVPDSVLNRESPALPSRTTSGERRGSMPHLSEKSTIERALQHFSSYAGWLHINRLVSYDSLTLEAMTLIPQWEAYVEHYLTRLGRNTNTGTASTLSSLAFLLAVVASPYLSRTAELNGDLDSARRLEEVGTYFRKEGKALRPSRLEACGAWMKIPVWEADGEEGYAKLDKLRDLLRDHVAKCAGDMSIEEQLLALRSNTFTPLMCRDWAVAVRDTVMISVLRRVPLRAHNLVALRLPVPTLGAPRSKHEGELVQWEVTDADRPWEGPILFAFPRDTTKTDDPRYLPLITGDVCGDEEAEEHVGRDFLELYLRAGGARDILLEHRAGHCPYVFVANSAKAKRSGPLGKWTTMGVSERFRNLIARYGAQLGIDSNRAGVFGATSIHVVRHLFATHFKSRNEVAYAAEMLMHADERTINEHYSFQTARALSYEKHIRTVGEVGPKTAR